MGVIYSYVIDCMKKGAIREETKSVTLLSCLGKLLSVMCVMKFSTSYICPSSAIHLCAINFVIFITSHYTIKIERKKPAVESIIASSIA